MPEEKLFLSRKRKEEEKGWKDGCVELYHSAREPSAVPERGLRQARGEKSHVGGR